MVTGVYPPEINGAVLQCEALISALASQVDFEVLTGTDRIGSSGTRLIRELQITRVYQGKRDLLSKFVFAINFLYRFIRSARDVDIVHIHGFSLRNSLAILMARVMGRPVVLKMSSYGQDDPLSVKKRSKILWHLYNLANAYIAISPAFIEACKAAGIEKSKCHFVPNGVNTSRFCPVDPIEKIKIKTDYGLKLTEIIVLYVGHFSREKRPALLYGVWAKIVESGVNCTIIFIGKNRVGYEVDAELARRITADSTLRGLEAKVIMVEQTGAIEEYMKLADVFVHPSIREGLPNVVLESMSSGLPCVVTDLPGVTDWIIKNNQTGMLFPQDDEGVLGENLEILLRNEDERARLGSSARQYVLDSHRFERIAEMTMAVYVSLVVTTGRLNNPK